MARKTKEVLLVHYTDIWSAENCLLAGVLIVPMFLPSVYRYPPLPMLMDVVPVCFFVFLFFFFYQHNGATSPCSAQPGDCLIDHEGQSAKNKLLIMCHGLANVVKHIHGSNCGLFLPWRPPKQQGKNGKANFTKCFIVIDNKALFMCLS